MREQLKFLLHFGRDRAAAHGFFHAACSKNAYDAGEMLKINISRDAEKFVCIKANTVRLCSIVYLTV